MALRSEQRSQPRERGCAGGNDHDEQQERPLGEGSVGRFENQKELPSNSTCPSAF